MQENWTKLNIDNKSEREKKIYKRIRTALDQSVKHKCVVKNKNMYE